MLPGRIDAHLARRKATPFESCSETTMRSCSLLAPMSSIGLSSCLVITWLAATLSGQGPIPAPTWAAQAPATVPVSPPAPSPAGSAIVDPTGNAAWRASELPAPPGPLTAVPGWMIGQGSVPTGLLPPPLLDPAGGEVDVPSCVNCVCGELVEGEPLCSNGYVDLFNGGCNSTPTVSSRIACGQSVCGTYGTYQTTGGQNFRDTDWYRFTLSVASDVTWTVVGEARTRVFLLRDSCPASSIATGVADACQPATVTATNLAPGSYYAFVGTDAFTGVPCGSRYRASLTVVNCCAPACQFGDQVEAEPLCQNGYVDNTNGGCNTTPNVFGSIDCGQSVCGTYGTYVTTGGQNFRDTDWYRFTLPVASDVTWTATGGARTRVFILQGSCPASSLGTAAADACQPASVTLTNLPAGTYYAFVGTDAFTGVPCGTRYRATLTVGECCVGPCRTGDLVEAEPLCQNGYVDNTNGGCNTTPNVFGSIDCGQSVCGTYGTYVTTGGQNFRDTDWYRFTLLRPSNVTWTAVGEARTRLFVLQGSCPASSLGTAVGDPCQTVTVTLNNLPAGTYNAFVGTDAFTGVPCGARYRATLTVTDCCVGPCQPLDSREGEVVCSNGYVDLTNGGCNSTPNVFGTIQCGETVCGSYGTYQTTGGQNFRDTDWYQFTLPTAATVSWTATGEARTRLFLMRGSCPATSIATAAGDACTTTTVTANLAAGTYYAFVGTDVFTGVACGLRYRATLIATPCVNSNQITSLDVGCGNGGAQTTVGTFALGSRDFRFLLTGAEPAALLLSTIGFAGNTLPCGGCTLTDPADVQFQLNNGGTASRPLPIPCNASLGGLVIDAQWVSFATSASPCATAPGLSASNRLRCNLLP